MHNKQRNIITSFYYVNFFWVFSKAYKTLNSHYNSINTNRNFTAYSCLIRGIHIALNNLLRFALIYKTNKKKEEIGSKSQLPIHLISFKQDKGNGK